MVMVHGAGGAAAAESRAGAEAGRKEIGDGDGVGDDGEPSRVQTSSLGEWCSDRSPSLSRRRVARQVRGVRRTSEMERQGCCAVAPGRDEPSSRATSRRGLARRCSCSRGGSSARHGTLPSPPPPHPPPPPLPSSLLAPSSVCAPAPSGEHVHVRAACRGRRSSGTALHRAHVSIICV